MSRLARLGWTLTATLTLCAAASGQGAFFSGLGDFSGGSFSSKALAISADGTTVVGSGTTGSGIEPFRWTLADGLVRLGDLPGGRHGGAAWGASANGSVIVGRSDSANGKEAFRWTAATGLVALGDLPGGIYESVAKAVSDNGNVIVGWSDSTASELEAFRWTSTTGMVGLGFMDTGETVASEATALSADGSVIVGWSLWADDLDAAAEAFRWTPTTGFTRLGYLSGGDTASFANAVTPDGAIIAGDSFDLTSGNQLRGFRWTDSKGMKRLDPNGHRMVLAYDISADGNVIVGEGPDHYAAIWHAGRGSRDLKSALEDEYNLDLGNWRLRIAYGVSADGNVIVGWGKNPNGRTEAWIAYLTEAPGDFPPPPDDDGDGGDDDADDDTDDKDDKGYGNTWPPPWGSDPYGGDYGQGYGHPDDNVEWPDVYTDDDTPSTNTPTQPSTNTGNDPPPTGTTPDSPANDEQLTQDVPVPGMLCPTAAALLITFPLIALTLLTTRRVIVVPVSGER